MPLWKWETFLFLISLLSVDGLFVYSLIGCLLSILLSRYVWGIGNLLSLSDWLTAIMHTDHHGADSIRRSCPLLVSVLPQQEWCSAGQQAPDYWAHGWREQLWGLVWASPLDTPPVRPSPSRREGNGDWHLDWLSASPRLLLGHGRSWARWCCPCWYCPRMGLPEQRGSKLTEVEAAGTAKPGCGIAPWGRRTGKTINKIKLLPSYNLNSSG